MEESIFLKGSDDTPEVLFDKAKGIFEISGRSLPEDIVKFYQPIQKWLKEYVEDPNDETEFVFHLDYFNTSSTRKIIELIFELENIQKKGKKVKVIWKYASDDELMEEKGSEIKSVIKLPFEMRLV